MKFRLFPIMITLLLVLLGVSCTREEVPEADTDRRKSPIAIASVKHNDTYIKIVYGQPYKRGREIFGGLVPYDEVWRTGANEATELTTTHDIMLKDNILKAGTYALFTIPGPEDWTIIINRELGQWGAFDYNPQQDVFRIEVPASKNEYVTEAFTIQFTEVSNDSTSILMEWDSTKVRVPVRFISADDSTT